MKALLITIIYILLLVIGGFIWENTYIDKLQSSKPIKLTETTQNTVKTVTISTQDTLLNADGELMILKSELVAIKTNKHE